MLFSDLLDTCCIFLRLILDYHRSTISDIYDPLSFVLRITPGVGAAAPFRYSMPTLLMVLWVAPHLVYHHSVLSFVVLLADAPFYDTLLHFFEFY